MEAQLLTPNRKERAFESDKLSPVDRIGRNLMYDKRVYRGRIYNVHNVRQSMSPQD